MEILSRGQRFNIEDKLCSKSFTLVFDWFGDTRSNFIDLIPICFSVNGSVEMQKVKLEAIKQLKNGNKSKAQYHISLTDIPETVNKIVFIATTSSPLTKLDSFSGFSAYIISNNIHLELKPENFSNMRTNHILEIYKKDCQWRINISLIGYESPVYENIKINQTDFDLLTRNLNSFYDVVRSIKKKDKRNTDSLNFIFSPDQLLSFKNKILYSNNNVFSEEGTKTALILPFIQLLGYDIFNSSEFVPELDANFGIKKGEKVDYAILVNNEPVILIECKSKGSNLSLSTEQLFRYFNTIKTAKIGILTDGIKYFFFSDTENINIMDNSPFFEVDLQKTLPPESINYLSKFHKLNFNSEEIYDLAIKSKFVLDLKRKMYNEISNPSEDFINYFIPDESLYSFDISEIFKTSWLESLKNIK